LKRLRARRCRSRRKSVSTPTAISWSKHSMSRDPAPLYDFRALTEADLPLLARWLAEPHMAEWWGNPKPELEQIREHIDSVSVEPLIVELDGRPIAYLQSYDPHMEDDHPFQDQPMGTLGIDLSIGIAD